jgi:hypothetical protein
VIFMVGREEEGGAEADEEGVWVRLGLGWEGEGWLIGGFIIGAEMLGCWIGGGGLKFRG